jgi:hypothetical protein
MDPSKTPFQAAVRAVKDGMSGRAGLAAARAAGVRVNDSTWFRMVGEIRRSLSGQIDEITKPLNRRPLQDEIFGFQSKKATGFLQYIDVMVKDRETGLPSVRPYAVRTKRLYSRQRIIKMGLEAFQRSIDLNPGEYDEQVLGAVYTATYQYVPEA